MTEQTAAQFSDLDDGALDARADDLAARYRAAKDELLAALVEQGRRRLAAACPDGARYVTFTTSSWDDGDLLEFDDVLGAHGDHLAGFTELAEEDVDLVDVLRYELTELSGTDVAAIDLVSGELLDALPDFSLRARL